MTPFKAKAIVPLIRPAIAKNPIIYNADMKLLTEPYGKVKNITDRILQNDRTLKQEEIFGDPTENATYVYELKLKLEKRGHDVFLSVVDRSRTLANVYDVV